MDQQFRNLMKGEFVWMPEKGIGYFPVQHCPYDAAYFEKYRGYTQTPLGEAITAARADFVAGYYPSGPLLDIGIGCGDFVMRREQTKGYDINPVAVDWLKAREAYEDPYVENAPGPYAITCWDSLEHIAEPGILLSRVQKWVFMSVPIFRDMAHVLQSKHFRKDEHYWYWTESGLIRFMGDYGFSLIGRTLMEVALGREDIATFAFRRTSHA